VIPKNSLPVIRNIYSPEEVTVGHQEVFRVDVHDPDGDKLMYEWSFIIDGRVVFGGRDGVETIDPSSATPVLKLLSGHQGRIAQAVVTVSDGKAEVKRSTKSIPIKRSPPPPPVHSESQLRAGEYGLGSLMRWTRGFTRSLSPGE
jgi:hypothetical protein